MINIIPLYLLSVRLIIKIKAITAVRKWLKLLILFPPLVAATEMFTFKEATESATEPDNLTRQSEISNEHPMKIPRIFENFLERPSFYRIRGRHTV